MAYQFDYGFGLPAGEYRRIKISDEVEGRRLQEKYNEKCMEHGAAKSAAERKAATGAIKRIIARARKIGHW